MERGNESGLNFSCSQQWILGLYRPLTVLAVKLMYTPALRDIHPPVFTPFTVMFTLHAWTAKKSSCDIWAQCLQQRCTAQMWGVASGKLSLGRVELIFEAPSAPPPRPRALYSCQAAGVSIPSDKRSSKSAAVFPFCCSVLKPSWIRGW